MFLERESFAMDDVQASGSGERRASSAASARAAAMVRVIPPAPGYTPSGGRYGEGRKSSLPGVALAVAVHIAIVPVLLGLGYHAVAKKDDRLVAINLSPPPPPPPAAETEQQQKLETRITPPPVPIIIPVVQPVPVAIADPLPQARPAVVAAPPAPPATLAPPASLAPPSIVSADSLGTRMIAGKPPRYPVESRRRKEQGTVELLLVLGTDGAVETISVAKSSGFTRLDEAALSAVRRWRWQPTLRGGQAVRVRGVVEIPFVLQTA